MPIQGRYIAGGVGILVIIFAIAAIASTHWIETSGAEFGLFKIVPDYGSSTRIRDVSCNGNNNCETAVHKTEATSALMLIGLFITIGATITAFLDRKMFTVIGAGVASLFYFIAICVYGSIDRDNVFGSGANGHLKGSFGLAIITLFLSLIQAGLAFFFLEKTV